VPAIGYDDALSVQFLLPFSHCLWRRLHFPKHPEASRLTRSSPPQDYSIDLKVTGQVLAEQGEPSLAPRADWPRGPVTMK
jgi:hypothetical protein